MPNETGKVAMSGHPSFDNLMAQLRDRRNEAAALVFQRYANRLIELARRQLDPKLLQKIDPEDVMQSVFRSFLIRNAEGQFGDFDNWDSLWAMLVVMTQRKCGRRIDQFHAARRDVRREVSATSPTGDSSADLGLRASEPTPSEAAMLTETIEQLMNNLQGRHRQIVTMSLQGYEPAEIGAKLGCAERTVYRTLERVKEWLEATQEGADA
jgi:RNA polymerase sigma-70 factor, ECF subfamily